MSGEVEVAGRDPSSSFPAARREPVSKRLLDVVLASLGLVVSAPVWLVVPAAIKLEDGGDIFFRQERMGKGGEVFFIRKFRSLAPGDREVTPEHPDEKAVTTVGRLLRATALDELPQLLNILRGDMSFVGPRALYPGEVTRLEDGREIRPHEVPGFHERHSVRPGLTGLAQIRAPRNVPYRHKFRYDVLYVRSRSFWLDVKLIALSVWISLRGAWRDVGRRTADRDAGEGRPR